MNCGGQPGKLITMRNSLFLLLFFIFLFTACEKEYSCENCLPNSTTAQVSTLACTSAIFSDTAFVNEPYSGTCTIDYTGGNGMAYTAGASIPSTGVTGLSATLVAGTLSNGNGSLSYAISGTPASTGIAAFSISFSNLHCVMSLPVDSLQLPPVATHFIQIAAQKERSLVVLSDGTVKAWGSNNFGELGDGTTSTRFIPVQVSILTRITAVAAGAWHSLALRNDGTVWAWGNNDYGQLGDGTVNEVHQPKRITALSGMVSIAAGEDFSIALKTDGTVWAWGINTWGQLGDGSVTDKFFPVKIPALTGVKEIAAGRGSCVALKADGTLWTWGLNSNGALGLGSTILMSNTPVEITGLSNIIRVASNGSGHSLALKNDGSVWAWGNNDHGQLGDGTYVNKDLPFMIALPANIKAIGVGEDISFAIRSDGIVFAWGWNAVGELGIDYNFIHQSTPVLVSLLTGVKNICGGNFHTIVQKDDGSIWAMGGNVAGQLGDGSNVIYRYSPAPVNGL